MVCSRVGFGRAFELDDSDADSVGLLLDGEDFDVELVDELLLDGVGASSEPHAAANGSSAQAVMMRARFAVWVAITWFLSWRPLWVLLFCIKVKGFQYLGSHRG